VGGGIASVFFSSLERYSCIALSVIDSDDEEGIESLTKVHTNIGRSLRKITNENDRIGALRLELESCNYSMQENTKSNCFGVQCFHHIEFWYTIFSKWSVHINKGVFKLYTLKSIMLDFFKYFIVIYILCL
jgi:hypothetical protein